MAQRKTPKTHSKKEGKTPLVESKNGKRTERATAGGDAVAGGGSKYSMFTWFVVLALLGVWSSVAVVYFNIVDYDSVIGKLTAYDTDGDGDFDVEDAKVLLGLKVAERRHDGDSPEEKTKTSERLTEAATQRAAEPQGVEPAETMSSETPTEETVSESGPLPVHNDDDEVSRSHDVESDIQAAVPLPPYVEDDFVPDDPRDSQHPYEDRAETIDTTGVLVEEPLPEESVVESAQYLTSSKFSQEAEPVVEAQNQSEPPVVPEPQSETPGQAEAERTCDSLRFMRSDGARGGGGLRVSERKSMKDRKIKKIWKSTRQETEGQVRKRREMEVFDMAAHRQN